MAHRPRWTKSTLIFGGTVLWGAVLIGCVSVNRTMVAPPQIAGANFVGSRECSRCHEDQIQHFDGATHARLNLTDAKVGDTGCESCHGPGSLHVAAGGSKGTSSIPRSRPRPASSATSTSAPSSACRTATRCSTARWAAAIATTCTRATPSPAPAWTSRT